MDQKGLIKYKFYFTKGDVNTTLQDLMGISGNTLEDWTSGRTYSFVNENNIQLPLDTFAPQGFPSIRIIRPSDYEMVIDVSCAESTDEVKDILSNIITLFEDTGEEFKLSANVSNISCFGAKDGEISLDISGGFLPYQIEWFDGSSNETIQNLGPLEYTVTVTDALGKSLSENLILKEPDSLQISIDSIINETGNQQNGGVFLTINGGTLPYSFEWNTGVTEMNLSGLSFGDYSLTVSDANNCELNEIFTVEIISTVVDPLKFNLVLFPNPVAKFIHIKTNSLKEINFKIINNLGQIIKQGIVVDSFIDLEHGHSGLYQILLWQENIVIQKQFIKL